MRRRFFFIILLMSLVTVATVSFLQYSFFRNERHHLLDQQIESLASTLIASGLSMELMENLDDVDDLIHDALGEDRIDQIVNLYDLDEIPIYSNPTAKRLNIELQLQNRWQDLEIKGHLIRLLTIQTDKMIIQVGLILDSTVQRWESNNKRTLLFITGLFVLIIFTSFLSTTFIFKPIAKLVNEFQQISKKLQRQFGQPLSEFVIPNPHFLKLSDKPSKDELQQLGSEIKRFLDLLSDYTKSFQAQTAILTHELKTPLTVILNQLELIPKSEPDKATKLLQLAKQEVQALAETVNRYLQWAVLTSTPGKPEEIFANKFPVVLQEVTTQLEVVFPNRIQILSCEDKVIFCQKDHLKQVLKNLIENALKYSASQQKVEIQFQNSVLSVRDYGDGIDEVVLQNLGSPFNRSLQTSSPHLSSGLGLAWIKAVCEKYQWTLTLENLQQGSIAKITFTEEEGSENTFEL